MQLCVNRALQQFTAELVPVTVTSNYCQQICKQHGHWY